MSGVVVTRGKKGKRGPTASMVGEDSIDYTQSIYYF